MQRLEDLEVTLPFRCTGLPRDMVILFVVCGEATGVEKAHTRPCRIVGIGGKLSNLAF